MKTLEYGPDTADYITREISNQKVLSDCEYVVHCYYHETEERENFLLVHIVLEYCPGSDLKDAVILPKKNVPLRLRAKWLFHITQALAYMHERHIVHRDVKAENVLLSSENVDEAVAKLTDFGLSRYEEATASEGRKMTSNMGTLRFFAPEQFTSQYDTKVDVWALGILAHQLFTYAHPFDVRDSPSLREKHKEIQFAPFQVTAAPVHFEVQQFISQCLTYDPAQRPSAYELLSHPLFQNDFPQGEPALPPPSHLVDDSKAMITALLANGSEAVQGLERFHGSLGAERSRKLANYVRGYLAGLTDVLRTFPASEAERETLSKLSISLAPLLVHFPQPH